MDWLAGQIWEGEYLSCILAALCFILQLPLCVRAPSWALALADVGLIPRRVGSFSRIFTYKSKMLTVCMPCIVDFTLVLCDLIGTIYHVTIRWPHPLLFAVLTDHWLAILLADRLVAIHLLLITGWCQCSWQELARTTSHTLLFLSIFGFQIKFLPAVSTLHEIYLDSFKLRCMYLREWRCMYVCTT